MQNGSWTFTIEQFFPFRAFCELKTKVGVVIKSFRFRKGIVHRKDNDLHNT